MAAEALKSHGELKSVSTRERAKLLVGTPYEIIPEGTFNGRFVVSSLTNPVYTPATRDLTEIICNNAFEALNVSSE